MPDIQKGSVYMGGVDRAAMAINAITGSGGPIMDIINTAWEKGLISGSEADILRKASEDFGQRTRDDAFSLHRMLTDAAKKAGLDVPPPTDGTEEFIEIMKAIPMPEGGGR